MSIIPTANTLDTLQMALQRNSVASSDFDLNPEVKLPDDRVLRPAAVLVPLIDRPAGLSLILTKRASGLKHHPGQIAFPGGKQDQGDADLVSTALREAMEEIALPTNSVTILGEIAQHETVTGFQVTPILGHVTRDFIPVSEPGEVAEVFEVPLDMVLDQRRFKIQYRYWRGQRRYYYTVPWGPYYIWGATARMLFTLASLCKP